MSRLVEEIDLKEGPLDDSPLRASFLCLIQQITNIISWSDDCNVPKKTHSSLQLVQGMLGQMSIGLLELIFSEDELKFIREVVFVDCLQTVSVDGEQALTFSLL